MGGASVLATEEGGPSPAVLSQAGDPPRAALGLSHGRFLCSRGDYTSDVFANILAGFLHFLTM